MNEIRFFFFFSVKLCIAYLSLLCIFIEHLNMLINIDHHFYFEDAVFIEKILRVRPNVKKLYLLVRAADSDSAAQRFWNELYHLNV